MKLQQSKSGVYFLTIPKQLVKLAAWSKGQELLVVPGKEGNLEIRKV